MPKGTLPSIIVADPPWAFGDRLPGASRGAEKNYKVMTVDDICDLKPKSAPDSILFLWRVSAMPEEALRVARAWGYAPKSEIVWVKTTQPLETVVVPMVPGSRNARVVEVAPKLKFGMGRYVRLSHETCIIAAKGKAISLIQNRSVRSVFYAQVREHSAKPDEFYDIVETLTKGPYLEMFARRTRKNWQQWGDQVGSLDGGT